ncbi:hypothetical protein [Rheinheimera sp.]|uniref:hypothetical protein n=1 Tax=Rheinheimera sp. TaxID=1869214 RepID=UPI00273507C1|nr:hypothetical protein [Rheinheimera sp.]MDP2716884.1 hypothetical protein [Rheinheimera sp.]
MSYSGHLQGDIHSHCWFYESVRRSFEYDGYGETCGGITAISLTAFMLESYFNLSCKQIFDSKSKVEKLLDSPPDNLFEQLDLKTERSTDIYEKLAIAYGFKSQSENLITALCNQLYKKKKERFTKLCKSKSFYDIDDEIRFSPKAKFAALSDVLYTEDALKLEHDAMVQRIFDIRNSLAHGRSEFVKQSFTIISSNNDAFSSEMVPPLQASWQANCSLENAKCLFDKACEVITFISTRAFDDDMPFVMPTQIGAFTPG